jgi:hypothetical protein
VSNTGKESEPNRQTVCDAALSGAKNFRWPRSHLWPGWACLGHSYRRNDGGGFLSGLLFSPCNLAPLGSIRAGLFIGAILSDRICEVISAPVMVERTTPSARSVARGGLVQPAPARLADTLGGASAERAQKRPHRQRPSFGEGAAIRCGAGLNTSPRSVGGLNTPGRVDRHGDRDDARRGALLDKLGQRIDRL